MTTCESWNMNSNYQEWHNTTSNDTEERIALRMQDEECLSSLEKNLDKHFEKEYKSLMNHHVEPSWELR